MTGNISKYRNEKSVSKGMGMSCLWVSEFGYKRFVSEDMDMSEMWSGT